MADRERAARAVEELLRALGYEPAGDLAETGQRVAEAWIDELVSGERHDPLEILRAGSLPVAAGSAGPVVLRGLAVVTMCPHHLLPAHGTADVGYLPGEALAGIGVVARVVDVLARRLTLQEVVGQRVADAVVAGLGAQGAFCKLSLVHTCLTARGEQQAGAVVETLSLAGTFAGPARDLALALAQPGSGGR